jgi:hypothetical protein
MYVDESGDCGMPADGSPSRLFCLSGVVVHELRWRDTMEDILRFRHWLKHKYGVYLDDAIHAGAMINRPKRCAPAIAQLKKHQRLAIIRHHADLIATLRDISIINVVVDKTSGRAPDKDEVFRRAWYALFQRFENTIRRKNFPGPKNADDRGIVFPDNTDGQKLRNYLDTMRSRNRLKVFHPTGGFHYRDEPIQVIVEHPVMRDSRESFMIQAADCACYLLKQFEEPSSYMKRHGGNAYFNRLGSVLCKHASGKDPTGRGIVRL